MSRRLEVRRKVTRWESRQPPREWTVYLECGHKMPQDWDDARMHDERKEAIEKDGDVVCIECGEKEDKIADLKAKLEKLERS